MGLCGRITHGCAGDKNQLGFCRRGAQPCVIPSLRRLPPEGCPHIVLASPPVDAGAPVEILPVSYNPLRETRSPQDGGKMPGTQEIRTRSLLLRRHVTGDAAPLCENFGIDPAMFEYTGWNPYATPQMAEKTVREYIDAYADQRFYGWAIESAGGLMGTNGAYDYDAEKNSVEVGMSIERTSWGKGYATEALSAVLRYLTEEEGIATVTAWSAAGNIGSRRAMEKSGMVEVRTEKNALVVGGSTYDKVWYEFRGTGAKRGA